MSIVEQTRAMLEDIERLETAMVQDMKKRPRSHVNGVYQQHRIRNRIQTMTDMARKARKLLEDEDGSRLEEITNMSSGNVFSKFYDGLRQAKDQHRRNPSAAAHNHDVDDVVGFGMPEFTSEEAFGRYLDLHAHHNAFVNLKGVDPAIPYTKYILEFNRFESLPIRLRTSTQYQKYICELLEYLLSFKKRSQPMLPNKPLEKLEQEFPERWESHQIHGWVLKKQQDQQQQQQQGQTSTDQQDDSFDLNSFKSAGELESVGMDVLKTQLTKRGLKCGGNLAQRAKRLFGVAGLSPTQYPDNIKAGVSRKVKQLTQDQILKNNRYKAIALKESQIGLLSDLLSEVITNTAERVEKNLARTFEEIEMQHELEAAVSSEESSSESEKNNDSDSDDRPKNNPLKIPLGYDNKPIPYWLFKLHGLGIEYKCEICGNESYWGRRAFERHFQEWKHTHAMRCLNIPNTKHFHEVTKIEDAFTLYDKIKGDLTSRAFRADVEEEFEDSQGNVLSRKVYDDLARQGLL